MDIERKQCNEMARITLPWAGNLLNYCPVHANKLVMVGQAIGNPIQAKLLSTTTSVQCESFDELTDNEKELNKQFKP